MRLILSFKRSSSVFLAVLISLVAIQASAQLPFFPGAEGFGGTFTGTVPTAGWFSNATVYHVINLNDSGAGSLRGAFVQNSSNKVIVFDVAGTIHLTSGPLDIKNLSYYYIAGQTAPGPVTVYGDTTQINASNNISTSNVVLRYLTFRRGSGGSNSDSITFINGHNTLGSTNMILDHVSASWATDENVSVAGYNKNVTVQYTLIAEALSSDHAFGSLVRPKIDSQVTFHHNLYANDKSRNPRPGTYDDKQLDLDFRNNVIYNWSDRAGYTGGASEPETEKVNIDYVGNYAIAGPATSAGQKSETIYTMDVSKFWNLTTAALRSSPKDYLDVEIYQSGNIIDSNHDATRDGTDTGWGMFIASDGSTSEPYPGFNYGPNSALPAKREGSPFNYAAVTTQSAADAYNSVLNHVGNYIEGRGRDAIDARILSDVQTNTQTPGGVPLAGPVPSEEKWVTDQIPGAIPNPGDPPFQPIQHPAGYDTDGDAMPDDWEKAHGLNYTSGSDWNLDFDSDGYINLIEYLNEAGEFPAPAPIVYSGPTSGPNNRYELITNWMTNDGGLTAGSNWQPSKYDEAQINGGTVVSNKIGQHAGVLRLGANAGNNATLNVTGGWLDVDDELIIGADATATAALNLSGGELSVAELSKGAGGSFNFTGGTLHADAVNFDLVNNGGTLAPGHSIGQTHVVGDLTLASGTLRIELSSAAFSDTLLVDGNVTLGGSLSISTLGGFSPTNGNSWQIITAGSIAGGFGSITGGYSVQKQGNNVMLFFGLAGDYNGNGVVDAADYLVWRKNNGTQAGYDTWRANFGATSGSGASAWSAVPEPAAAALLILAAAAGLLRNRRRWSSESGLRVFGHFLQE